MDYTLVIFTSDNGPSLARHERGGCAGLFRSVVTENIIGENITDNGANGVCECKPEYPIEKTDTNEGCGKK